MSRPHLETCQSGMLASVAACESVRELLKDKLAGVRAKLHELQKLQFELTADLRKCNKELKRRQRHAASACPVLDKVITK
jgi:hypothetical protein